MTFVLAYQGLASIKKQVCILFLEIIGGDGTNQQFLIFKLEQIIIIIIMIMGPNHRYLSE